MSAISHITQFAGNDPQGPVAELIFGIEGRSDEGHSLVRD